MTCLRWSTLELMVSFTRMNIGGDSDSSYLPCEKAKDVNLPAIKPF